MLKIKKTVLSMAIVAGSIFQSNAFCGFYVAKADAKLFNKSSQIILVRDGNRSVITMSNDFQGDVKDFAMVVPVPEVLSRNSIRIANQSIFDKLDSYSGPRLVEYYDRNPCNEYKLKKYAERSVMNEVPAMATEELEMEEDKDLGVTIEATYTVGEYDILILSATESVGLKKWLVANDYKIPSKAEEVLDPYIKSNMKFFVVKVNLEKQKSMGVQQLRPIQIAFNSEKFMLPIRLGMANAKDAQDMIVYAFSKQGRVETTNYRTVKIPTDKNIPEFVQPKFGQFYKDVFEKSYKRENKKAVFLEYAWDVSFNNRVKCDPCVGPPPVYNDLREAGVYWLQNSGGAQVNGDVFFTRLHVRYDRKNFPQDLFFQSTPNKQRFQGRYVMNHAITYDLTCSASQDYYRKVAKRREKEMNQLVALTGWDVSGNGDYVNSFLKKIKPSEKDDTQWFDGDSFQNSITPVFKNNNTPNDKGGFTLYLSLAMLTFMMFYLKFKSNLATKR